MSSFHSLVGCLLVSGLLVAPIPAAGWKLATHRWVNEAAVEAVPRPLRSFFEVRREALSDLSVEPDTIRRDRYGREEAIRHYIHLDGYGEPPFRELPRRKSQAIARFGRSAVEQRGILPWTILGFHERLVRAFRNRDVESAVRLAGLVGHYVADAFMPLHMTMNHDGQATDDDGIHDRLEEVVDDRLGAMRSALRDRLEVAEERPFTVDTMFSILLESHRKVEIVLQADRRARSAADRGTEDYADVLDRELREFIRERLCGAARALGHLWWSAWDAAGRPELESVSS